MTKSTITREQLLEIIETDHVQCGEASYLARMALAAMASEHKRNTVLAYADSYRDMAKQGVELVPIWSVITDLERNIAPLYRHAQPAPDGEQLAIENFRSAMEGIGHISRTLEETFGGLHGTHVEPDVLAECKAICDAIYAAYSHAQPAPERDKVRSEHAESVRDTFRFVRAQHAEWSDRQFGDVGPVGPLKHLAKEAIEAAEAPDDISEFADILMLVWDATRRAGFSDEQLAEAVAEKLERNKRRAWGEVKDGEPCHHVKN